MKKKKIRDTIIKMKRFKSGENMATIKDVARESKLSVGTVSRYLNGEQLKINNQEAIEKAIEKLGYETNAIARSMKTGRTMTIAVVVPFLANMFSMRVIESIEQELQKENYSVIITDCSGDAIKEINRIEFLKRRQIDGMILMPSGIRAENIKKSIGNIPLVLVDRILDEPVFDSVIIDNEKMTCDYVCRLLETGIRKIGIIEGPQFISTARQRSAGYEKALQKYGIKKEYVANCTEYSFAAGYRGMKELQKFDLEAVFASNYELSVGVMNANTHDSLKILGFDTFEIPVKFQDNYTGIQQPVEEIGSLAAKLLLDRIHDTEKEITIKII